MRAKRASLARSTASTFVRPAAHCSPPTILQRKAGTVAWPRHFTYLDTYIRYGVYKADGIRIRNYCGAEPPRDTQPPGLVTTVGWRDRASASYAATERVKAPASAARGRFRGVHGGRAAPSLPAET